MRELAWLRGKASFIRQFGKRQQLPIRWKCHDYPQVASYDSRLPDIRRLLLPVRGRFARDPRGINQVSPRFAKNMQTPVAAL
jgi:hypothetical protein